jgi:hypothetical protein
MQSGSWTVRKLRSVAALALVLSPLSAGAQDFTPAAMLEWSAENFKNRTVYSLDGPALRATCNDSASGLFLRKPIDLRATPILEWSWRVDTVFSGGADERKKGGDDFPARIYVVRDGGLLPWRTQAISYVWSSSEPVGSDWPNPYASQARMVVLRSGPADPASGLVGERRNLREDFRKYHGVELDSLDALAIMTDCDDRSAKAEALYGTLRLTGE